MASVTSSTAYKISSATQPPIVSAPNQGLVAWLFQQISKEAQSNLIETIRLDIRHIGGYYWKGITVYPDFTQAEASQTIDASDQNLKNVALKLMEMFKAVFNLSVLRKSNSLKINLKMEIHHLNSATYRLFQLSAEEQLMALDLCPSEKEMMKWVHTKANGTISNKDQKDSKK